MKESKVWFFCTGKVNPLIKASSQAVKYISKQKGFLGVYPYNERGTLWIFNTENNAKIARNKAEAKGIVCGGVGNGYVDEKYLK